MNVRVKICGITRYSDAVRAVECGASALGFVFFSESPRSIPPAEAARILHRLPPFVAKVGVFVNAPAAEVSRIAQLCGLDTLQFHGDESPEYCRQFRLKTIRAIRVQDRQSLTQLAEYTTDAWLLDSYVPGKLGGTGAQFSWEVAREAKKWRRPIVLAGGLKPENVAQAVAQVQPYGVDVSSGVEEAPGRKDPQKIEAFMSALGGGLRCDS